MIVYLFDGSFEGFLTCIYYSYYNKKKPELFIDKNYYIPNFTYDLIEIGTEKDKFERVYSSLEKKLLDETLRRIYYLFLSSEDENYSLLYEYIKLCFKYEKEVDLHLNNDIILNTHKLARRVSLEAHRFTGFVRFQEVYKDTFYSKISPDHNILPLLLNHFVNRFSSMRFIIHDTKREIAIIYDGKKATLGELKLEQVPKITPGVYEELWKRYFKSTTILERENPRLQKRSMPKRYWTNLPEI